MELYGGGHRTLAGRLKVGKNGVQISATNKTRVVVQGECQGKVFRDYVSRVLL